MFSLFSFITFKHFRSYINIRDPPWTDAALDESQAPGFILLQFAWHNLLKRLTFLQSVLWASLENPVFDLFYVLGFASESPSLCISLCSSAKFGFILRTVVKFWALYFVLLVYFCLFQACIFVLRALWYSLGSSIACFQHHLFYWRVLQLFEIFCGIILIWIVYFTFTKNTIKILMSIVLNM